MRPTLIAGVWLGASLLSACGSDQAGTDTGRAEAIILDTPSGTALATGTLQGNIFASMSADGSTWVNLGSPNGITVTLQTLGSSTTVHGEQTAPAGSYRHVRLVFEGVTARLQAGSRVGGTTLASDATVGLGGTDNRVEVGIEVPTFTVDADLNVRRTIVFELRSQVWLTEAALQAGRVEDAALQAALTATTRVDPR